MRPFRQNVAIAIDGGGIKGTIVARALMILEDHLGQSAHNTFRLSAGTSTGSILSAGIATGLTAEQMHAMYEQLGQTIFRETLRSRFWLLSKYRYPHDDLENALHKAIGDPKMGDVWHADPATDLIITVFDLQENRTRFIKSWKPEYQNWPVVKAVLASSSVPTYFPAVDDRYVDGGVGSFSNPAYIAAFDARNALKWDPSETTLISLGTGKYPAGLEPSQVRDMWPWQWIGPTIGAFLQSADNQQIHAAARLFGDLDFRRFNVDLREPIEMDDASDMAKLTAYGDELGRKILADDTEEPPVFLPLD
ncbi:MAG: patatin-like phospholipase family protein [Chloroflexota bacterium]|nr:patatin-like phospholipase family protein [Chloroflexota bacterium]